MKNQNTKKNINPKNTASETKVSHADNNAVFSWKKFSIKVIALVAVVIAVVYFTDKKGYFIADQKNNHIRRKWASFYDFSAKKEVDVIILGNSHVITGVDPFVLSTATGANCFILGNSGTNVLDAWFQLGEALKYTTPKLVVLETYCINEQIKPTNNVVTPYLQSFDAQKGLLYKLRCMPELFESDSWVAAWSPTIRNHSFLLKDWARIKKNYTKPDKYKPTKLDLGRFARFNFGLQDTTLQKYETLGPPVDGRNYIISDHSKKYLKKVMDLCAEKNIPVAFLTVPMYKKHITNYDAWKNKLGEELSKYPNTKWLDLQDNYDTLLFTPDKFENTYSANQHLSNLGMSITAFKLAYFIEKEFPNLLPNRTQEAVWIKDFMTNEYYPYIQEINPSIPNMKLILKNKQVGNYLVKELAIQHNKETDRIILKLESISDLPDYLDAQIILNVQGNNMVAPVKFIRPTDVYRSKFTAYFVDINKGFNLVDIVKIGNQ